MAKSRATPRISDGPDPEYDVPDRPTLGEMSEPHGQPPAEPERLPTVIRPCSLVPGLNTPLTACPTNLDLSTPRGKALAVAAGSPGNLEFGEDGTACIDAVNYLIFAEERLSEETGEVVTLSRTVLFDRNGRTFRTTSETAPHALHRILQLYTEAEWAAGIPLIFTERRSRKTKRTYHDMRVRMPAEQEGHGG